MQDRRRSRDVPSQCASFTQILFGLRDATFANALPCGGGGLSSTLPSSPEKGGPCILASSGCGRGWDSKFCETHGFL